MCLLNDFEIARLRTSTWHQARMNPMHAKIIERRREKAASTMFVKLNHQGAMIQRVTTLMLDLRKKLNECRKRKNGMQMRL